MPSCALCSSSLAPFRCGKCRAVVYCSAEHQKEHWKTHKISCLASHDACKPKEQPPLKVAEVSPIVDDTTSRAVSLLHGLRKSLIGDSAKRPPYLKQGAIATLLAPDRFLRTLFPGSSHSERAFPQSLEALLGSHDPSDEALIREAAVRAVERGAAILAGVRRRGTAEGDELTAAMEATLWPQVQ